MWMMDLIDADTIDYRNNVYIADSLNAIIFIETSIDLDGVIFFFGLLLIFIDDDFFLFILNCIPVRECNGECLFRVLNSAVTHKKSFTDTRSIMTWKSLHSSLLADKESVF